MPVPCAPLLIAGVRETLKLSQTSFGATDRAQNGNSRRKAREIVRKHCLGARTTTTRACSAFTPSRMSTALTWSAEACCSLYYMDSLGLLATGPSLHDMPTLELEMKSDFGEIHSDEEVASARRRTTAHRHTGRQAGRHTPSATIPK